MIRQHSDMSWRLRQNNCHVTSATPVRSHTFGTFTPLYCALLESPSEPLRRSLVIRISKRRFRSTRIRFPEAKEEPKKGRSDGFGLKWTQVLEP